jgi:hypothetical protein
MPRLKTKSKSDTIHKTKTTRHAEKNSISLQFSQWNQIVESFILQKTMSQQKEELPAQIWDQWLWYTDPQEPPTAEHELNQCQLLGLLICRYRCVKQKPIEEHVPFCNKQLNIVDKNICCMSLRELRDTLSNATMQWANVVQKQENSSTMLKFLDMCFHRFGEFCWASWEEVTVLQSHAMENPIADDISYVECIPMGQSGQKHQQITFSCMRNMLNTFLILYRLVSWQVQSESYAYDLHSHNETHNETRMQTHNEAHNNTAHEVKIEKHHVQASLDFFYKLGMFYDLMPAARLNYMHNFSGLYNCVSQPAYFHNPDYERRVQISLDRIQSGEEDVHTLPALMQMFPSIILLYEDDDLHKKFSEAKEKMSAGKHNAFLWAWMVTAAKRIYLIKWDSQQATHQVFFNKHNPNIIHLLQKFYIPWYNSTQERSSDPVQTMAFHNLSVKKNAENQIMTYFKKHFRKKI